MRTIVESIKNIDESKKFESNVNFDLKNDIYNALSALAYEYDKSNKKFEEDDVKDALDNFMDKFWDTDDDD